MVVRTPQPAGNCGDGDDGKDGGCCGYGRVVMQNRQAGGAGRDANAEPGPHENPVDGARVARAYFFASLVTPSPRLLPRRERQSDGQGAACRSIPRPASAERQRAPARAPRQRTDLTPRCPPRGSSAGERRTGHSGSKAVPASTVDVLARASPRWRRGARAEVPTTGPRGGANDSPQGTRGGANNGRSGCAPRNGLQHAPVQPREPHRGRVSPGVGCGRASIWPLGWSA